MQVRGRSRRRGSAVAAVREVCTTQVRAKWIDARGSVCCCVEDILCVAVLKTTGVSRVRAEIACPETRCVRERARSS
eukprot:799416-Rhodomonas_salina.1